MDKFDPNRMWKDLQDSAREFASYGLQLSSKAIEAVAGTLSTMKDELAKTAERISPKAPPADETTPSDQPKS